MNATRAANGDSISALPVSALLLDSHSYLKPDAVSSPAEVLTEDDVTRIHGLWTHANVLSEDSVTVTQLLSLWGGDAIGLFEALTTDSHGRANEASWGDFWLDVLQKQGRQVLDYYLKSMDRTLEAQRALMTAVRDLRPKRSAEEAAR